MVHTKVSRPVLPAGAVSRPRLLQRLVDSPHRVILVTGPAGFGKSVLVSDWLRRVAAPCGWLSLDELDNDPKRLLNHLSAALRTLGGEAAAAAAGELRRLRGGADLAREADFAAALHQVDASAILVLDDVHQLDSPAALDLLTGFLEVAGGPRLVLLSRVNPAVPLARLRVAGQLLELREDDLRFTAGETEDLFTALLPGGLEPELAARLVDRTEGWVAGLRMAAIALEYAADRRAVVDAFTGSHQFVADYLVEEAVSHQPESVQRFLMETSILGRFTADACVAVTGDPDAAATLRTVDAASLFLIRLGSGGEWYRYHHLFAELLQYRLQRLHPARPAELHLRASRWFETQGDITYALEHAARAGDVDRLAELLDRHALAFLSRSEMASLSRWLGRIPDPLSVRRPTLLLAVGWLHTLAEKEPDLTALFDAGTAAVREPPPGYDSAALAAVRAEFEILRAYHARFGNRFEEAIRIGDALLPELPPERVDLRGRILFNQGRSWMMLGDMGRALPLLEQSLRVNTQAGTHYLVLTSLAQGAAVQLETMGAVQARRALEATVRFATERQLTRMPAYSAVLFQLGCMLTIEDDLDGARPYFEEAVRLGTMGDMPDGRANGLAGLARILAAQGNFEEAGDRLLDVAAMARTQNVGLIEGDVSVLFRRHALSLHAAGDVAALPAPCAKPEPPSSERRWDVILESLELCRMLEALRRGGTEGGADARQCAERIVAESERLGRRLAACVARVVLAILDEGGRWQEVDAVLADAAYRSYVRPLLDIGPPLKPLLHAALGQPISAAARTHARKLLDRLDGTVRTSAAVAVMGQRPGTLTDREAEVLEHLCRGLSNKAIARALYVSPETVKTHLKHIFDKLEVTRRRDAVARARALKLVELR